MNGPREILWFSRGVTSAVMVKLGLRDNPAAVVAHCATNSEDPDNDRFEADCVRWWNAPVVTLQSDEYHDTWEVWEKRRWINGVQGAVCSGALKFAPRLEYQRPDDVHAFGYDAGWLDVARAKRMRETYPELTIRTPLIDLGIDKAAALAIVEGVGITPPRTYAIGLGHANCIPCAKAESPGYWAVIRRHFPAQFWRFAALCRDLGARCLVIGKVRYFVDELPEDWPLDDAVAPSCDFLCQIAGQDLAA